MARSGKVFGEIAERFEGKRELGLTVDEVCFINRPDVNRELEALRERGWVYRGSPTVGSYWVGTVYGTTPEGRAALRERGYLPSPLDTP